MASAIAAAADACPSDQESRRRDVALEQRQSSSARPARAALPLLIDWAKLKQVSIFSLDNSHHSNNYQYYDVLEGFRMVLTIAVLLFPVSQHGDSAYAYNFPIVLFTL